LDGYYAAAGSSDGTIAVWDVAAGKLSWNFTAHSNPIDALEFAPRGDRLATAARGGEVRLWKHGESKPEFSRVLGSPGDPVYDMAFTPNEKTLVVSGYGCIHLPSLEPGGGDRKISSAEMGNMYCIDVSRDGSRVAAGGGGLVSVWNLRSLRLVATLRGSLGLFTGTVSLSPDGGRVIASDNLRVSWLWDLATGREVGRFGPSQLGYAHFQPDGNTIVISRFAAPNPLRVRTWAGLAFLRAPTFAEISETEKADAAARQRWMRENGTTR
jgi:WD40 repeat protein